MRSAGVIAPTVAAGACVRGSSPIGVATTEPADAQPASSASQPTGRTRIRDIVRMRKGKRIGDPGNIAPRAPDWELAGAVERARFAPAVATILRLWLES